MDNFDKFLDGTVTLFSDPLGIAIFFGGVIGGMLFGAIPGVSMQKGLYIFIDIGDGLPLDLILADLRGVT